MPSVHGAAIPNGSVLYLSPWCVQGLLARPRVFNYNGFIFSFGEETNSFRNVEKSEARRKVGGTNRINKEKGNECLVESV